MTVKNQTLSEAIKQVLTESSVTAGATSAEAPKSLSTEIQDLGGATQDNPEGNNIADKMTNPQAAAPKGPAVEGDGIKKIDDTTPPFPAPEVKPAMATPSGSDDHKHPTMGEEISADDRRAAIREVLNTVSIEDDMNALFAGSDLSEEFKAKAKTIFEAAVTAKAIVVVEQVETIITEAAEASIEEIKAELETNVEAYLDKVVVEWKEENKVAIEAGLRMEIHEEFIEGLRNLFIEHDLNIPAEKVNVVEELTAKVEALTAQINEELNKNIDLSKQINEARRKELVVTAGEGLTATQAEKLKTLAEGVEFTTESEYTDKLKVIRDQYFSNKGGVVSDTAKSVLIAEETLTPAEETVEVNATMAHYLSAISRTVK